MAETTELDELSASLVRYSARRHLALYVRTRDGLLIWKAFSEYRKAGLPVPENILAKLDEFAQSLVAARGDSEIATALEMSTGAKGSQRIRLKQAERNRDVAEEYRIRVFELKQRPADAIKAVAANSNLSNGNVKRIVSEWGGLTLLKPQANPPSNAKSRAANAAEAPWWLAWKAK